ncbi:hypothetical protein BT67DRAFT_190803 [Trichocladium antarcticum]|uniref:GCM domain-containing protein n=1 Tax=Trichocladium antarcticum TaxID=1450529 RepID=A0AAN6ZGI3_9PEZI|nr:hypothetical protein BT67DRAFT_190803 [Trichocladium antarcticum]
MSRRAVMQRSAMVPTSRVSDDWRGYATTYDGCAKMEGDESIDYLHNEVCISGVPTLRVDREEIRTKPKPYDSRSPSLPHRMPIPCRLRARSEHALRPSHIGTTSDRGSQPDGCSPARFTPENAVRPRSNQPRPLLSCQACSARRTRTWCARLVVCVCVCVRRPGRVVLRRPFFKPRVEE